MYNLSNFWYTELPTNKTELDKLFLILYSQGFSININNVNPNDYWLSSFDLESKELSTSTNNVTRKDFNNFYFQYIPLDWLLTL